MSHLIRVARFRIPKYCMGPTYIFKKWPITYLKFKFNGGSCILSSNSTPNLTSQPICLTVKFTMVSSAQIGNYSHLKCIFSSSLMPISSTIRSLLQTLIVKLTENIKKIQKILSDYLKWQYGNFLKFTDIGHLGDSRRTYFSSNIHINYWSLKNTVLLSSLEQYKSKITSHLFSVKRVGGRGEELGR